MTRRLDVLDVAGRRGRRLAAELDLARSLGARLAWRRLREEAALTNLGERLLGSVYREIWSEAAAELGADVRDLSRGFFELRRGEVSTRVWHHVVGLDDAVTLRLALDKSLGHALLGEAGLPVPDHAEFDFRDLERASAFLAGNAPCVVKPASGTAGGDGVTCGIRGRRQLARARLHAAAFATRLLIERQAPAPVHRLLVLDGRVLGAIRRGPATVVGDGRSRIRELIAAENAARLEAGGRLGTNLLRVDLDCVFTLRRSGLSLDSVPERGQRVEVKTLTGENRTEDNETVAAVGDELAADAVAAAEALRVRLAGVDVATPDTQRSFREAGGVVLEVNATPALHYHYHVADRERANRVAVPILETLLEEASGTHRVRRR